MIRERYFEEIKIPRPLRIGFSSDGMVQYGYIYFIQSAGFGHIKIGTAINIRSRMKMLQTGNENELYLVAYARGDEEAERKLHEDFKHAHFRGEWFNPEETLLSLVQNLRDMIESGRVLDFSRIR